MTKNKQLELENKRLKEIIEDKIGTILKLKRKMKELESYNHSLAQKLHRKLTKIIELEKENEQLKKDRFICLDCEYSGYTEIGCLCEKKDCWTEYKIECEDYEELE